MKKFLAIVLAAVAGLAVPSFAADADNCVFKDKSLCVTESLSPTTGD